jgi:competence protein ComEC
VGRCLDALGVDTVAALILTHLHEDHVGGMSEAIQGRTPQMVLAPAPCGPAARESDLADLASRTAVSRIASSDGDGGPVRGVAGEAVLEVFPSPLDTRCSGLARKGAALGEDSMVNDASLAIRATVPGVTAWVLGDLEDAGQAALARVVGAWTPGDEPTTVAVVAHHGTAKPHPGLATALSPDVAAFSAGRDNDYGHPTASALALYGGAVIVRTDQDGHVAVRADGRVATARRGVVSPGTEAGVQASGAGVSGSVPPAVRRRRWPA